jgi:hypothetical protein
MARPHCDTSLVGMVITIPCKSCYGEPTYNFHLHARRLVSNFPQEFKACSNTSFFDFAFQVICYCFLNKSNGFFIEGWGCFVFRSMILKVILKFDNYIVIMDHMCVERVILIWMLLSLTLGNSLFCTSRARDLLFQNFVTFNVWGSTNFVDFDEKMEKTL